MENILDVFDYGNIRVVKVKNPLLKLFYFPFNQNLDDPMITDFGRSNSHDEGNILYIHTHRRYFHDFFENFAKISVLAELGEKFKVVLIENDFNNDSIHKFQYFESFLGQYGIHFSVRKAADCHTVSSDVSYAFFMKHEENEPDMHIHDIETVSGGFEYNYFLENILNLDKAYHRWPHTNFTSFVASNQGLKAIKDKMPKYETIPGRKIYISRKHYNNERNVDEIEQVDEYIKSLGYKTVYLEHYLFSDQIRMIQEAEKIISFGGGHVFNFLFCSEDQKIKVLHSKKAYEHDAIRTMYYSFKINIENIFFDTNDGLKILKEIKEIGDL